VAQRGDRGGLRVRRRREREDGGEEAREHGGERIRALDRYLWYLNTRGMPPVLTRAERQQRTREELVDAAECLFSRQGFHATSIDAVAAEAGFTTGAIYSNFESKEDLFFAVYERRADAAVRYVQRTIDKLGPETALERMGADTAARRGRDDGWLAVFLEFWAHVVRRPELRARFAEIHARASQPVADAVEQLTGGGEPPMTAAGVTAAMNVMQIGLALERLTRPGLVDPTLQTRMTRLALDAMDPRA
jgi:AcrR family transcriptional regulator